MITIEKTITSKEMKESLEQKLTRGDNRGKTAINPSFSSRIMEIDLFPFSIYVSIVLFSSIIFLILFSSWKCDINQEWRKKSLLLFAYLFLLCGFVHEHNYSFFIHDSNSYIIKYKL